MLLPVVVERVGHLRRFRGNCAFLRHDRSLSGRESRRLFGTTLCRIGHALSKSLEPQDTSTDLNSFLKKRGVCGYRDTKTGCRQVLLKPRGVSRVRSNGSDVAQEVFRLNLHTNSV